MKWAAVLWGKPSHELREYWPFSCHSCKRFWKGGFHKVFVLCFRPLNARPKKSVIRAVEETFISLLGCLSAAFVSGCWGYSLGPMWWVLSVDESHVPSGDDLPCMENTIGIRASVGHPLKNPRKSWWMFARIIVSMNQYISMFKIVPPNPDVAPQPTWHINLS